jgi:hypothetical protein
MQAVIVALRDLGAACGRVHVGSRGDQTKSAALALGLAP